MRRCSLPILLALVSLILRPSVARAATDPADSADIVSGGNRVLKLIDFEERRLGNFEDLPMHWSKVTGPGLPHYVNGELSHDRARSGDWSFRFDLNGGSLIYRYDPFQLPITVGAHYRVQCYCQTTPLPNARAQLTAYFTDADGQCIASTIRTSPLYSAKQEGEGWRQLSVELNTNLPQARYVTMELALLQPSVWMPSTLGARTLRTQDIFGSAWFDDVAVLQVPEVAVQTDRPGNVFFASDSPRIFTDVDDPFTANLVGQVEVTDADGNTIYQRTGNLLGGIKTGPTRSRLTVDLPDLPAGWYRVTVRMSSGGTMLTERSLNVVRLADSDDATVVPDHRFGMIAEDLPFSSWDQLPQILPLLGAGRVKLSVWNRNGTVNELGPEKFDALLEQLRAQDIDPTACLTGLPPDVGQKLNGAGWEGLIDAPPEAWQPQLAYLISRHAARLDRWQIGADGSDAFVQSKRMRQVYRLIYQQFANLVDSPDLAMPWPAWYELDGQLPATIALSLPTEVLPNEIPLYTADVLRTAGAQVAATPSDVAATDGASAMSASSGSDATPKPAHNLSLALEPLDGRYGRQIRLRDFAQRMVYALAGNIDRIDVPLPLNVQSMGDGVSLQPDELLLVERTLIRSLAGSVYKGQIAVADGVDAFLFDQDGKGIVVLWTRSMQSGVKSLALNMGDSPQRVDLWGNVTPLAHTGDPRHPDQVEVEVGPMPIVLLDVDSISAQMRASIAFDQPLLESSFTAHTRRIHFTNPAASPISGTLRLVSPKQWTIEPSDLEFDLQPGQTLDRQVTINFPYSSVAGTRTVMAEFAVQGAHNINFAVPLTLKLGLSDVGMQTIAIREGTQLMVQEMITNYSEAPISYQAYAAYPGQPRMERLVADLPPGHTTIKLYRFHGVKFIPGEPVKTGLRELEDMRLLNDQTPIE